MTDQEINNMQTPPGISKEDINALLEAINQNDRNENEEVALIKKNDAFKFVQPKSYRHSIRVKIYDFKRPQLFTKKAKSILSSIISTDTISRFNSDLRSFSDIKCRLSEVYEITTSKQCYQSKENEYFYFTFNMIMNDFSGPMYIEIPSQLAHALSNRYSTKHYSKSIDEPDIKILEKIMKRLGNHIQTAFRNNVIDCSVQIVKNKIFNFSSDTPCVCLSYDVDGTNLDDQKLVIILDSTSLTDFRNNLRNHKTFEKLSIHILDDVPMDVNISVFQKEMKLDSVLDLISIDNKIPIEKAKFFIQNKSLEELK